MHSKIAMDFIVSLTMSLVVLWIGTFLSGLTVRAQQTVTPRSDYVNALWVVGADEMVKIASADGTVVFAIPGAQDVHTVAVDARCVVLWAYGDSTLLAYSFNGTFVRSVPISQPNGHSALAVNADDGTVWLGINKALLHLDAQGHVLHTIPLAENVQALALDTTAARLWVGTQRTVSAYSDAGSLVASIQLGTNPGVQDIAFDTNSGAL
jgi:ligand-binding sensor domain-containing protein